MPPEAPERSGFIFDSASCSGCKACQVACKDKHGLPVGINWRRVVEVSGGGWQKQGAAWVSDVFAYHLSIACNHCQRPICVEACPSQALYRRPDGIILIDDRRCLGCGYCAWACPYGAPQYDARAGKMTKCTLCVDELAGGKEPACVAACPLRTLNYGTLPQENSACVFPLPAHRLTEPAWQVQPHSQASRANAQTARLANREEIIVGQVSIPANGVSGKHTRPTVAKKANKNDWPLVAFTLLAQTAVGAWLLLALVQCWLEGSTFRRVTVPVMALLVGLMGIGLLLSFAHLGTPKNAWRALSNWRTSWLSREIGLALGFTGIMLITGGLITLGWLLLGGNPALAAWLAIFTGLPGLALVYCMGRVYQLRTVPAWNRWQTQADFFLTTFFLGDLLVMAVSVLFGGSGLQLNSGGEPGGPQWAPIFTRLLWLAVGLFLLKIATGAQNRRTQAIVRQGLLILGLVITLTITCLPYFSMIWYGLFYPALLLGIAVAVIDRASFYRRYALFQSDHTP